MKEWLTAQEIAAEALPQIPCTKRGVNDLAEREGWNLDVFRARKRTGRGGGMEYHIGLLPSLAQVSYRQRSIPVGPLPAAPELQSTAALSGRAALERDARLAILRAYDAFERGQRLNRQGCEALFVSKYQSGTLHVETWVRELVPAFSRRTLARWRAAAAADAASLGHDRGAARKGTGVLDTANAGAVKAWILGLIAHQPHLSAGQVIEQVRGHFGDTIEVVRGGGVVEQIEMPPLRTFQVMLKALKVENEVVLTKLTDPDRFRSHMRLAGTGSMRHITQPNMLWQIDASPVDALCTDGRHSIYMCIDVASRRVVVYITKTPRAAAVGLLLRKAILAWGVPGEIKIDNGSDFKAKSTQRLLASLGIKVDFSDAFSPEQKGFVERVIGTFQRSAVTLMPGFIGHNVADRKAIEGRKSFAQRLGEDDADTFAVQCTAAEMQEHFDAWSDLKYQHTPHSSLGKRSPFEVAATTAHTIRRVDDRALDLLLAPMSSNPQLVNAVTLTAITSGADPTLDSFAEALTRFVIDEGQISGLMTMLGKRVRVDAAQGLSAAERIQAKQNLGADGTGRRYIIGAAGTVTPADVGKLIYCENNVPSLTVGKASDFGDGDTFRIYARGTLTVSKTAGDPYTFGFADFNRDSFVMRPGDRCTMYMGADAWDVVSYATTHDKALMADRPLSFNDTEKQQLLTNAGLLIPIGQAQLVRPSTTQIRLDRCRGSNVFVNGAYRPIPPTGVPASNSGLQPNSVFYTFTYWTGSALALAIGIGPPAVDPLYGHLVAGGQGSDAQNRIFTYVGAVLTDANGQFRDDDAFRGVASLFNPVRRTLSGVIATNGSTASQAGAVLGSPLQFVLAEATGCDFSTAGYTYNENGGQFCRTDITLDQTAAGYPCIGTSAVNNANVPISAHYSGIIPAGAHAVNLFGSVSGGTGHWNAALFGVLG